MMIHIPSLSYTLSTELNLIQNPFSALDDISLPYWNNELRFLPVFLIQVVAHVLTHTSSYSPSKKNPYSWHFSLLTGAISFALLSLCVKLMSDIVQLYQWLYMRWEFEVPSLSKVKMENQESYPSEDNFKK